MKVAVTETGGALGFPRRVELDSAALSENDARELAQRSRAVSPATAPPRSYAGEIGYAVRVDDDDDRSVEASYLDSSIPNDVRDLVDWVRAHPKHERGPGAR